MKQRLCTVLICMCMLSVASFSYAQSQGRRSVYKVNPGESYILDGIVTTKDGKRKKVRLIVRVPQNTRITQDMQQGNLGNLVAPNVGNELPSAVPDEFDITGMEGNTTGIGAFDSMNAL